MSSLFDFAITAGLQQEQDLREAQQQAKATPFGGNFGFRQTLFLKVITFVVLAPCLIPLWLLLMPFRLAGKVDQLQSRFKPKSTSKKQ